MLVHRITLFVLSKPLAHVIAKLTAILLFSVVVESIPYSGLVNDQNISSPFQCDNIATSIPFVGTNVRDGPNIHNVPPSTSRMESLESMQDREYSILTYYAQLPLPLNDSSDDYSDARFTYAESPTNPMLNSRNDVRRIVNRYISRILLGCYNNSDMDEIFLHPSTRPFAAAGTSTFTKSCYRDGDYDFATINLLQLVYVARQYPGSMPDKAFAAIRDNLLSIYGTITGDSSFLLPCQVQLGPTIRSSFTVQFGQDTENHILQTEISRYLTNQLLLEAYPKNQEYNNTANGNTVWLLEHMSTFLREYFYEYNSRPYQGLTINAILVLHSFALDTDLVLVAEMLLDVIMSFSGIQTNQLRRFVPFRRQPQYAQETQSWKGDTEFYRLALLVGNYGILHGPDYVLPKNPDEEIPLSDSSLVRTIASQYRLKDFVWNTFFRSISSSENHESSSFTAAEYFVSSRDVTEMYYTTPKVLISAGGNSVKSTIFPIRVEERFCLVPTCLLKGYLIRPIIKDFVEEFLKVDRGWSRPTTIVPSNEPSTEISDMVRFIGHRDADAASLSRNLCVAPNFVCGLQLEFGNKIDPILDQCSVTEGDWRFLDLTESNSDPSCPTYGYYMAVYVRTCSNDPCSNRADNYGLIEISEAVVNMSLTTFQQTVLSNNPFAFSSTGIHNYTRITGEMIQFEINPASDDDSQILQVDLNDGQRMDFDRKYQNWPMAWSANGSMQSTSAVGRWTFDTDVQRYIYDVTDAFHPKSIVSNKPNLIRHPIITKTSHTSSPSSSSTSPQQQPILLGRYFDDSTSVVEGDTIQSLAFTYDFFRISGFRIQWRKSGLQSSHGWMPPSFSSSSSTSARRTSTHWLHREVMYELEENESIITVGIGSADYFGQRRVNRIRMVIARPSNIDGSNSYTNRTIVVGFGRIEEAVYETNTANTGPVIAFYGRASENMMHTLGVVTMHDGPFFNGM